MPKRPKSHRLGAIAVSHARLLFEKAGFACDITNADYGEDLEISFRQFNPGHLWWRSIYRCAPFNSCATAIFRCVKREANVSPKANVSSICGKNMSYGPCRSCELFFVGAAFTLLLKDPLLYPSQDLYSSNLARAQEWIAPHCRPIHLPVTVTSACGSAGIDVRGSAAADPRQVAAPAAAGSVANHWDRVHEKSSCARR